MSRVTQAPELTEVAPEVSLCTSHQLCIMRKKFLSEQQEFIHSTSNKNYPLSFSFYFSVFEGHLNGFVFLIPYIITVIIIQKKVILIFTISL